MINKAGSQVKNYYGKEEYRKEKEAYDTFQKLKEKFENIWSAVEVVNTFSQADVSKKGQIQLFFQSESDGMKWNLSDFTIYEEVGKAWKKCEPVSISQMKDKGELSIDLVADVSTSMEYVFYDMKNAVNNFVNSVNGNVNLGLSELSSVYTRKNGFTTNSGTIRNAVDGLVCHGSTALYESLYSSVSYTAKATGARCVIAFTDGINESYDSTKDYTEQDVIDIAKRYKVPIYLIGIGTDIAENVLMNIANETGGWYQNLAWGNISSMDDLYRDIYESQLAMYQLTYRSSIKDYSDRNIYIGYYNADQDISMRVENNLQVSTLSSAYSEVSSGDIASYYLKKNALTTEELDDLRKEYGFEGIQTLINVYFAKELLIIKFADFFSEMLAYKAFQKRSLANY